MPTRNVNLTEELDRFVAEKVETGRYGNASDVVRAALRSLEREEREYEAKLEAVRDAIRIGIESGVAPDGVFERVRARMKVQADGRQG
jgi:antitoxin ParD1/3/4